MSDDILLEVEDLHTSFDIEGKWARAVRGVSFQVHRNEVLGIVGESGSGKSVTALSLMRLVPDPPGRIVKGEVRWLGRDLLQLVLQRDHLPALHILRRRELLVEPVQLPLQRLHRLVPHRGAVAHGGGMGLRAERKMQLTIKFFKKTVCAK